jgi:DNA-binding PadR family transcriptional regulator
MTAITATPARARLADPQTSWDAALTVNATKSWLLFAELRTIEKDEWIGEELTNENEKLNIEGLFTALTPSRVRTIVSDWKKQGYVEELPKRAKTSTGRTARLHRLTPQGRELVAVLRDINRKANQQ